MSVSSAVFDTLVPDWESRVLRPLDLEKTLIVTGGYHAIYHLETETGRNVGVHPALTAHWGVARVSDPSRLDCFALGCYTSCVLGPASRRRSPIVSYGAPGKGGHGLSLPRWISDPKDAPLVSVRNVIPLRGMREDEDLFVTVPVSRGPFRLWSAGQKAPLEGEKGGVCRVGSKKPSQVWSAGDEDEDGFVPFSRCVSVSGRTDVALDPFRMCGGAEIHERLMCLCLGGHNLAFVFDVKRMFEGARVGDNLLFTLQHADSNVEAVDTTSRFEGLSDWGHLASAGEMTNVACTTGTSHKCKFWDLKTGNLVGETEAKAWPLVNRFVPARGLWLLGTKFGIEVVDVRKLSEVAASFGGLDGKEAASYMRDVNDVGSDGRTFVSASQTKALSLWTLDDALKVKVHWVRRMPKSNWSARPVNKGRDGFLFGEHPDDESEEFVRVMFWLELIQDDDPAACCVSCSESASVRIPRCFL